MRKTVIILITILLVLVFFPCMAEGSQEEAIRLLREHCYVHLDGGEKLHADPYCRSVHPKYQPRTETEFDESLLDRYSICPICTETVQPEEEPSPLDQATLVMPEEEIYRITAEWEEKYGFSGEWDYQVNAAFSAETGTIPYTAYVFDASVLPVMPDEDAIPAEEIAGKAVSLAASYGSRLTEEVLADMKVIVAEYVKTDNDVYLFSATGSWLVKFIGSDDTGAWMYVDAHTGVPNFLYIYPDGVSYIGEPGVEATFDEE